MLIAIFVLAAVLVMLIFSRPIQKFKPIRWVIIVAVVVLIIFCGRELYLSYYR